MADLHPDLRQADALLGTWAGTGHGEYPTIDSFDYAETVAFGHVGKPFLSYQQRTHSIDGDTSPPKPLHAETGYWRFPSPGRVEIIVSHPTGITEIDEGSIANVDGELVIDVHATSVTGSTTAKSVTALHRTFRVRDDTMTYRIAMAAVGQPLQHHLAATLIRQRVG